MAKAKSKSLLEIASSERVLTRSGKFSEFAKNHPDMYQQARQLAIEYFAGKRSKNFASVHHLASFLRDQTKEQSGITTMTTWRDWLYRIRDERAANAT